MLSWKRVLVVAVCAFSVTTHAAMAADRAQFDLRIDPEPLSRALQEVAKQTGVQIIFFSEVTDGYRAPSLSGRYTVPAALSQLLDGSPLTFQQINARTIQIEPRGSVKMYGATATPVALTTIGLPEFAQDDPGSGSGAKTNNGTSGGPAAASDSAPISESATLQEIIITAERRKEDEQKIAASVSVRNGDDLLRQAKYSLADILEDVPGVGGDAANGFGGTGSDNVASGITIRGIASNVSAGGSSVSVGSATALYVDGVYEGVGRSYDIDRVEVLRGPQGTLYGRSATAGLIAVHTRNPELDKFGGDANVEFGNYDLKQYGAAVNLPVGEQLAVRVSANRYQREGYYGYYNAITKQAEGGLGGTTQTTDGRVKVLYQPSDSLSVLLGFALEDNINYSGGTATTESFDVDAVGWQAAPIAKAFNKYRQYWAEFNWDVGIGTLTWLPAYRTWVQGGESITQVPSGNIGLIDEFVRTPSDDFDTQELRLASNADSKLIWQVGALYYGNHLKNFNTWVIYNTGGTFTNTVTDKSTKEGGIFAQATYPFSDDWRLTLGGRYDYTKIITSQDYTFNPCSLMAGVPACNMLSTLGGDAGTRVFRNWTYKVRAEHDLAAQHMVYGSIATGFSPGDVALGQGTTGVTPIVLQAETLTSFELGSKNRFLGDTLQVNGDIFYNDYGAYQTGSLNVSGNANTLEVASIAVPVQSYGAEFEVTYQMTPVDRLGLTGSYIEAYFLHKPAIFADSYAENSIWSVVLGATPGNADLSYDHIVNIPGGSTVTLHGDARYLSSHQGTINPTQLEDGGTPYVHVDAQVIGNLSATWAAANRALSITGWVRNVADNRYISGRALDTNTPPFEVTPTVYQPRTYGVSAHVSF